MSEEVLLSLINLGSRVKESGGSASTACWTAAAEEESAACLTDSLAQARSAHRQLAMTSMGYDAMNAHNGPSLLEMHQHHQHMQQHPPGLYSPAMPSPVTQQPAYELIPHRIFVGGFTAAVRYHVDLFYIAVFLYFVDDRRRLAQLLREIRQCA